MVNSNRTYNISNNWRRIGFTQTPIQIRQDEDLEVQISYNVNDNIILEGFPVPTETIQTSIGYDTAYSGIVRNINSIATRVTVPNLVIPCGFDIFDGYLIYTTKDLWYQIKVEVVHKPPQHVLDLLLKIYEGTSWEDKVK